MFIKMECLLFCDEMFFFLFLVDMLMWMVVYEISILNIYIMVYI